MDNDVDLYDDLPDNTCPYTLEELLSKVKNLEEKIRELEVTILKNEKDKKDLIATNESLHTRITSLYLTAKKEIDRKNNLITELQQKLDDIIFRRRSSRYPESDATKFQNEDRFKRTEHRTHHKYSPDNHRESEIRKIHHEAEKRKSGYRECKKRLSREHRDNEINKHRNKDEGSRSTERLKCRKRVSDDHYEYEKKFRNRDEPRRSNEQRSSLERREIENHFHVKTDYRDEVRYSRERREHENCSSQEYRETECKSYAKPDSRIELKSSNERREYERASSCERRETESNVYGRSSRQELKKLKTTEDCRRILPYNTPMKIINSEISSFISLKLVSPISATPDHLRERFNEINSKICPIPMINEHRALEKCEITAASESVTESVERVITTAEDIKKSTIFSPSKNNYTESVDSVTTVMEDKKKPTTPSPRKNGCITTVLPEETNNLTNSDVSNKPTDDNISVCKEIDTEHRVFKRKRRTVVIGNSLGIDCK